MTSSSEQSSPPQRVLSIQSHVVSGYVGNKAAVFPLQLLGFDVDVINSVHFSNHTGYDGGVEGDVLNGDQLHSLLNGLERNGLLANIQHVLTGFIGSESFLTAVMDVVLTLRKHHQASSHYVRFVCDPVLGDAGRFYVPRELVDVYKHKVIPLADVVTPNQFEVEQLTGIPIQTAQDAMDACKALHDLGPNLVFITSVVLLNEKKSATNNHNDDNDDDKDVNNKSIAIFASRRQQQQQGDHNNEVVHNNNNNNDDDDEVWRVDCPCIPGQFTGTGDLCAALLLGHTANNNNDHDVPLSTAIEKVISTMFSVIQRTAETSGTSVASRELKLIQCKDYIEHPPPLYKAYRIS